MDTKKTILVVDDEASLVKLLKMALENEGYHVVTAANGKEALARLEEHTPDLIVLDLNMPEMNGFEFFTAISTPHGRSKYPTLVLTEKTQMKAVFDTVEGDGFIPKPFELLDFLARVKALFERGKFVGHVIVLDPGENLQDSGLRRTLEAERYRVSVANQYSGFETACQKFFPDFVVMEYVRDDIHGDEMILKAKAYLKGLKPDLPPKATRFIVYTRSGMDYRQKALKAGADLYLGPLKKDEDLIPAIRTLEMEQTGA